MVLSSAIVCDRDRRIADDRRPYCDLRSAIRDHMETSLKLKSSVGFYFLMLENCSRRSQSKSKGHHCTKKELEAL